MEKLCVPSWTHSGSTASLPVTPLLRSKPHLMLSLIWCSGLLLLTWITTKSLRPYFKATVFIFLSFFFFSVGRWGEKFSFFAVFARILSQNHQKLHLKKLTWLLWQSVVNTLHSPHQGDLWVQSWLGNYKFTCWMVWQNKTKQDPPPPLPPPKNNVAETFCFPTQTDFLVWSSPVLATLSQWLLFTTYPVVYLLTLLLPARLWDKL